MMETTLNEAQKAMLVQIEEDGPSCVKTFEKAYTGNSRRLAMRAMCLQCCWLDRQAVAECQSTICPLWKFRPFQNKLVKADDDAGEPEVDEQEELEKPSETAGTDVPASV